MLKVLFAILSLTVVFLTDAGADELYRFLDNASITLEGNAQTTKLWTADEKQKVEKYFETLRTIAPELVLLASHENALGPIKIVRVDVAKRSIGFAKRDTSTGETYLILTDMFFKAYDVTHESVGYDGGNYSLWFFVHEMVHLAEFRSLPEKDTTAPTLNPDHVLYLTFETRISKAQYKLYQQKINLDTYKLSTDRVNVDIVHDLGLPTKYSLFSTQEALAETVSATILSPAYQAPPDILQAIDDFYRSAGS